MKKKFWETRRSHSDGFLCCCFRLWESMRQSRKRLAARRQSRRKRRGEAAVQAEAQDEAAPQESVKSDVQLQADDQYDVNKPVIEEVIFDQNGKEMTWGRHPGAAGEGLRQ